MAGISVHSIIEAISRVPITVYLSLGPNDSIFPTYPSFSPMAS